MSSVGNDGSLLCSTIMMSRLCCCGESVLQMLTQNKAILLWCGDSGTITAVGAVILMLQTVIVLTLYAFATICF